MKPKTKKQRQIAVECTVCGNEYMPVDGNGFMLGDVCRDCEITRMLHTDMYYWVLRVVDYHNNKKVKIQDI
jgi:hypothetical protein